jgi:hypothetical protein
MCETRIDVALSEGGRDGGPSGISRSCTESGRGVTDGVASTLGVALGVPDGFEPGPGGGSLGRLHATSASTHESRKTKRPHAMREVLAKREPGANSRAFLEGQMRQTGQHAMANQKKPRQDAETAGVCLPSGA